jgi:hypothetical protein
VLFFYSKFKTRGGLLKFCRLESQMKHLTAFMLCNHGAVSVRHGCENFTANYWVGIKMLVLFILSEKPIDAGYDQQPGRLCAKRVRQPALA